MEREKKNRTKYQISAASTTTTTTTEVHAIKIVRKSCVGLNILNCLHMSTPYFQLVGCLLRISAMLLNAEPIKNGKRATERAKEKEKKPNESRDETGKTLLFKIWK